MSIKPFRLPSPWKRMGGKANLHKWIISRLPHHEMYVEVFGGSAPVLLNKDRPKGKEVYNDLDKLWDNSLFILRERGEKLARFLAATPYGRAEFERAREILKYWRRGELIVDPLELARLHMVVVRQSYSANDRSWSTSGPWGENRAKLWAKLPEYLVWIMTRMQGIYIEQKDYDYILQRYDDERTTFYLDPPYEGVEDKYYDVNRAEGFDHGALREALEPIKGSAVVSYYSRPSIEALYAGWKREERKVTVNAGHSKRQETEVLFIRPSAYGRRRRRIFRQFSDLPGVFK